MRYSVLKGAERVSLRRTDKKIAGLQAEILEVLKLCIQANQERRYSFRSKLPCIDQDVHLVFCMARAYEVQLMEHFHVSVSLFLSVRATFSESILLSTWDSNRSPDLLHSMAF